VHTFSNGRQTCAVASTLVLCGTMFLGAGCGRGAGGSGTEEIAPASFKADPGRMTPDEKRNFERLTGSKSSATVPSK
jgi:hypothetical protein